MNTTKIDTSVLNFDMPAEVQKIGEAIRTFMRTKIHRRGLVVAMSGGIDSSVCAALAVQALGPKKVFGLLLPEADSSAKSAELGTLLAKHLGINFQLQNITPALEALDCYGTRDRAIQATIPQYKQNWKSKIVISGGIQGGINFFQLIVESPDGKRLQQRLDSKEYLEIVAATNYKQRIRKSIEYFHADRLNYAVVGTPNRLEYDQGFFVKNGDGTADIKPIAHLYKSQVYALARQLGLPDAICNVKPTTDTYSLAQGQDEFYFALPYEKMDLALWAHNHKLPASVLAKSLQIDEAQATHIYRDIETKRKTTKYLHAKGLLIEPVGEIEV